MRSSSQLLWAKVDERKCNTGVQAPADSEGLKTVSHIGTEEPQASYLTSLHLKTGLIHCLRIAINRTHRILMTCYVCVK